MPVSYDSIQIFAPLPVELLSHMRLVDSTASGARFDITLAAADGTVVAEIRGFQMQQLPGATNLAPAEGADASAEDLGLIAPGSAQPLSPEERRLHRNIAQGIRAEDGPEALRRALATGLSQVVVSSLALPDLIAQADQPPPQNADTSQSFERPQLDTDYLAPRNTVEEEIAAQFARLLGVAQVGVEDSFFDLGGHSLIAVRLFAQINRAYQVEFPISVLFEAPNVAALAAMIAQRTGQPDQTGGPSSPPAQDFTHLVTLHQGAEGAKTPFFLVAGMFGNVLNLRHLALMLGHERPVYGLQARGLIGDDDPHLTMEDAAADYIAELRQVQPRGPYLLGGFSGGGITAFEMARQLRAAGEEVALLALLDTPLPVRPGLSRRDKALIKLQELRRKGAAYLGEWAGNRLRWELQKRRGTPPPDNAATAFNNARVEAAFRTAIGAYKLQRWDGSLVLFRPKLDRFWKVSGGRWVSREKEYVFEDNAWTSWAPRTQVIEVPGDHDSMVLVPNVSVLAERLKACIDATETAADPETSGTSDWPDVTAAE